MRRKGELTRNESESNQIKRRKFATRLNEKEVGMLDYSEVDGASPHRRNGAIL